MDLYVKLLKRSFPLVDISLTEEWKYNHKKDLEYQVWTLSVSGRAIKKFHSFKELVEAINYLAKDEVWAEELASR